MKNKVSRLLWPLSPLWLALLTLTLYAPALTGQGLPWGSDTLGHLMKVDYLAEQWTLGRFYPNLFPGWYLGIQLFRYYPPLPYYLLLPLYWLSGMQAASWFVAVCAWAGSLAFLRFERWFTRPAAFAAGAFFLLLPDTLRVSFAEGNLPRALAMSLFPWAVWVMLSLLQNPVSRRLRLGLAVLLALTVLSHAMMAAIGAAVLGLVALLAWLSGAASLRAMLTALAALVLGLLLSGWWLLPSLQGGITGLDARAMTEALAVVPWAQMLLPNLRQNPEGIYAGAALLWLVPLCLVWARPRPTFALALTLSGWLAISLSLPGVNALFNALPLSNLLWPLRFLSIGSALLLLAFFELLPRLSPAWLRWGLAALILLDFIPSLRLIFVRPANPAVLQVSQALKTGSGWRVAALEDSRLASPPSYFFSAQAGREQVFGWAYQGARTALNVASLNEARQFGHETYLLDRLNLYGVDDVLSLEGESPLGLEQAGFRAEAFSGLNLFSRPGGPRALGLEGRVLGIGRGAQNLAFLFPNLLLGPSEVVDSYSLEELSRWQAIYLSGFRWENQTQAENLLRQAADAGVKIVVDLTGVPPDPLAQIPHFLNVWGEPVFLDERPLTLSDGRSLPGLGSGANQWHALVPQGLAEEKLTASYLGQTAVVWGSQPAGRGAIDFIGFNLVYFAAQTRNPQVVELLRQLLPTDLTRAPAPIPVFELGNYRASADGYDFDVSVHRDSFILIPVAAHQGFQALENGRPLPALALENLVALRLPAGKHHLSLRFPLTGLAYGGTALSALSLLALTLWLWRGAGEKYEKDDFAAGSRRVPAGRSDG